MEFSDYKNLWVFIETDGSRAASVGLELLNPAWNWPISWARRLWR